MYLESMTIDEIMELIENKGYMSFELWQSWRKSSAQNASITV